jgi:hypothetical protein
LVLDPVVAEVKLTKVLIDGGSGLNLIFVSTLKKMGLEFKDMLVPSKSPFYGIVPGNAAHPLGTVVLPVVAEPTLIIPAQVRESTSEGSNVLQTV